MVLAGVCGGLGVLCLVGVAAGSTAAIPMAVGFFIAGVLAAAVALT
jgi:hypothetical protein